MKVFGLRLRLLALLVSVVCATAAGIGAGATAVAQPKPPDGAIVRQQLPTGHELLVYVPDGPGTGLRARSTPILIVFADHGVSAAEALAVAGSSGLAEIAEAEQGVVAFVNPIGTTWTAADTAAVPATIGRFDGYTGEPYATDGQRCVTNSSGELVCKFPGLDARVYLFGDGAGADFITQHVIRGIANDEGQPWTPTAVYLSNPTKPAVAPDVEVEVPAYVVNGSKAVNASLERLNPRFGLFGTAQTKKKDGFQRSALLKGYDEVIERAIQRRWRVPVQIYPLPDAKEVGLRVRHESLDVNGAPLKYVEYAPRRQPRDMPLVLVFHGFSDQAEYMAWSTGWVDLAAKHGFMVVSVDQHRTRTPAEVITLLDHLLAEHPRIDESRVYATGFSMGAGKTWSLVDQYADRFAAVAPMGGAFGSSAGAPSDTLLPTIYYSGMESDLGEWPHKDGRPNGVDSRLAVLFASNGVTDDYAFDGSADPVWGIAADESITIADDLFTDISVKANAYASEDGHTYTVLTEVHHAGHETVTIEGETAWAFLSQFSRSAEGEIEILDGAFDLSALGARG